MRRKRATIGSQAEVQHACTPFSASILQQRNTNIFDTIFTKLPTKKSMLAKKTLTMKLQQVQKEHCCIDIVNRKNFYATSQNRRVTNIEFLKQEINYLQRDQLKWDMFPKENHENEGNASTITSSEPANEFQMHFVNRIELGEQAVALKAFRNTFKANFSIDPQSVRPTTTDQKRLFKCINDDKKRKGSSLLPQNNSERRTIHSNFPFNTPFRKHFQHSRTKRNKTSSVQVEPIEGKRIAARALFLMDFTE